jgi:lipopolysaccharide export system protein LptA
MSSCGPSTLFARLPNTFAGALLLLLCLPAVIAQALPDDQDQPIHITADKALRDEVEGVTIYSGSVHLVQGSMELDADKLTIYHTTDAADEIIAEGHPAKMRQQPELDKGIVHAHAKVITYFKSQERVHLQTDARIEQEGAVVDGDSIDYFIAKQLITAESDTTQEDNKVVVVIPPSVKKEVDSETSQEQTDVEVTTEPVTEISEEGVSDTTESE